MSARSKGQPNKRGPVTDPDGQQLRLLAGGSKRPDWVLDERTRKAGRQGLAGARETLRHARPPEPKTAGSARKAS